VTPRPDEPPRQPGDEPGRESGRGPGRGPGDRSPPERGASGSSPEASIENAEGDRPTPGSSDEPQPAEPAVPVREPTPLTQQVGRVVIVLLAVLFGVFAVDNNQPVDFSWVFGESRVAPDGTGGVPLIVLLVAAAAIGAALGALIEWQFLRARRARRAGGDRARGDDGKRAHRADRERD